LFPKLNNWALFFLVLNQILSGKYLYYKNNRYIFIAFFIINIMLSNQLCRKQYRAITTSDTEVTSHNSVVDKKMKKHFKNLSIFFSLTV